MSIFRKDVKLNVKARGASIMVIEVPPSGTALHGTYTSYEQIYRESFAVRSVVDFIARHVSRYHARSYQVGPTGEVALTRDVAADLFNAPAPGISRHEMMRHLALGVMITGNAFAPLIVDAEDRVRGISPTGLLVSLKREQGGPPKAYEMQSGVATPIVVKPENMLHVRTWSPSDPWVGVSPLDSLRALLSEEKAASKARELLWQKGLRRDGVIEREIGSREMTDESREDYRLDMESALGGEQAAWPWMLEIGHHFKESQFNPQEAQFVESRNLVLRAVAGAYGLPPQLVGSESRQSRVAFREIETALSPWVNLLESAVNAQLVPRIYPGQPPGRIRVRFESPAPITDQEIGQTLDNAVKAGRLTPDEARAVVGLPPIAGGDRLTPVVGGAP